MTILIKGMEMPQNCYKCKFCRPKQPYSCHCYAGGFPIKPSETDLRDGLCPLVPVPTPHGRLGDLDALVAKFHGLALGENSLFERFFADGVYAVIDCAPTVIEAEE